MISFSPSEVKAFTEKEDMAPIQEGSYDVIIQACKEGTTKDNSRKVLDLTLKLSSGRVIFTKVKVDGEELRMKLTSQLGEDEPSAEQEALLGQYNKDNKKMRDLIVAAGILDEVRKKEGIESSDLQGKRVKVGVKNSQFNGKVYTNVIYFNSIKTLAKPGASALGE